MGLIRNSIVGYRRKGWGLGESLAYFVKGVSRELGILPSLFLRIYEHIASCSFNRRWLKRVNGESYYEFAGAYIPDVSVDVEKFSLLRYVFEDVYLFPCCHGDDYSRVRVEYMDRYMAEGPYGYTDGLFDVTVKAGDVVIDAGAWIGDFSAYVCSKGALCYAFEPVQSTYRLLEKTKELNAKLSNVKGGGNLPCL
jgi:hypothetical protein